MAFQVGGAIQPQVVNLTASASLSAKDHAFRTVTLNAAAGMTVTLPVATGSGDVYRIILGTTVTSNNYVIQAADASNVLTGFASLLQDGADTAVHFEAAADSDTITMNGTTKGGLKGTFVDLVDIATNTFAVKLIGAATGTEATPFSAAVS
jgi:hypothetical protein